MCDAPTCVKCRAGSVSDCGDNVSTGVQVWVVYSASICVIRHLYMFHATHSVCVE